MSVQDGVLALELLKGGNGKPPLEKPYVVILDLNMPRMNGLEFLDEIRADEDLQFTPVFVLTTSDAEADKVLARSRGISGYVVKSTDSATWTSFITMLDNYQRVVDLPA